MICSMTAFGNARVETEHGTLNIEFRTVNNRYLDIALRLPEDLRFAENLIRTRLGAVVTRGKVDARVNFSRAAPGKDVQLDTDYLNTLAQQLNQARAAIPDLAPPRLTDILNNAGTGDATALDPEQWGPMCEQACDQALAELDAARRREGARLADMMRACASDMGTIVAQVEADLPGIQAEHQKKVGDRLRDALHAAHPDGFASITGEELSARISQESVLFALRIDVAEELGRLRSHLAELEHILADDTAAAGAADRPKSRKGSAGKRMDFLFQEMNREANTLGSKASALSVTQAAIELKLLIEQMREQAQNIE
jgi:uncharacterized protein (TIGR00255 family)